MTFLDLFSGIGGFRLGMEMAGHICVGHCEIDQFANKSYIAMHKPKEGEWYADDITRIRAEDIPKCDCWCFGFPCQDISVAGKQQGFRGQRSSLFFTVTQLIRGQKEENKPSYLLIENVKNILSINRGVDFARLLMELDEIGYNAERALLNTADVLPQNRERVFIIGHLRGRSTGKVFPIGEEDRVAKELKLKLTALINGKNNQSSRIYDASGLSPALNTFRGATPKVAVQTVNGRRARYVTPRECFRLQGFLDDYFERVREVCSDTQLYKQAGNGVTVPVVYEIAKKMEVDK